MPKTRQDMDSPSLWDRLNTSRRRLSHHSALDELHQTLSNLEQRLVEFHQRAAGETSFQTKSTRSLSPEDRRRDDEDALAEIANRLRQMTGTSDDTGQHPHKTASARKTTRPTGFSDSRFGEEANYPGYGYSTSGYEANLSMDERRAHRISNIGLLDLLEKLDALSDRVDTIAYQQTQPDSALTTLIGQLDHLARGAIKFIDSSEQTNLGELETRLDQIESKLVHIESDNQAKTDHILAELDRKFLSLAQRLDAQAADQSNQGAIEALETKFNVFAQKLNQDIEQAVHNPSTRFEQSDAFRVLDQQIAHITQLLEQPDTDVQSLKPRLEAIESSLLSTNELVITSAREAAQAAVERAVADGVEHQSAFTEKLVAELRALEELSQNINKQHNENLSAVQSLLNDIGGRLSLLEQSHGSMSRQDKSINAPTENHASNVNVEASPKFADADDLSESSIESPSPAEGASTSLDSIDRQSSLFPQADDEKLPDLHSIVKRVRAQTIDRNGKHSASSLAEKPDVVTIARRSVMRSSIEIKAPDDSVASKSDDSDPSKSPDPTRKKRKSILFGFGAALVALAGLHISLALKLGHNGATTMANTSSPEPIVQFNNSDNIDRTNIVGSISEQSEQLSTHEEKPSADEKNSKAIRIMQLLLQADGYDVGQIDGSINEQTGSAIKQFRTHNGLESSDMIDKKFVDVLLERTRTATLN